MRVGLVSLLVCLLAPLAGARTPLAPPPSPEVQAILEALMSSDGKLVAWAAHHAGRLGVEEAAAPMARRLDAIARFPRPLRHLPLALTLLDALARLRATPPAESVMPYFDGWGSDHVLAILARHPHRYRDTLLEIFDDHVEGSFHRRVAGSLLASARVRGFAFHVLSGFELALHLELRDSDTPFRAPGSAYIRGSLRERKIVPPEGWPPASSWYLGGWRRRTDERIAAGPPALYLGRNETDAWHYGYGFFSRGPSDQDEAFAWTARLLRTDDAGAPLLWCRRHAGFIATGPQPYLRKLRRLREEFLAPYWALVERLLEDGSLTAAEARRLRPGFTLVVRDLRRGWAGQPLPTLRPPRNPYARAPGAVRLPGM